MAFANHVHAPHAGFADKLANLLELAAGAVRRRQVYSRTVRELNALTNRELADLGIHRSMINSLAVEAAYGK